MEFLCGTKEKTPGYRFQSRHYDQWQVIIVMEGSLGVTLRETDTLLRVGHAAVLPVGSRFSLWCRDVPYRGVYVIARNPHDVYSGQASALEVPPEMATAAGLVEAEARSPRERSESYLSAVGRLLAQMTLRATSPGDACHLHAPTPEYWVSRARPLVERSIYSNTPLGRVLAGLDISYRQLTRHFRSVLGTTPKQYQVGCRFREARRLLAQTSLSITSIAMELGYASSQHFSSRFAAAHGEPPSRWRRRHSGSGQT